MDEIFFPDASDSNPPPGDFGRDTPVGDVPCYLDVLAESGREVLVVGDVIHCKDFNHKQGMNLYGFEGTCGLVSCEDVLRQFGKDVSENDVVRHAVENRLCYVGDDLSLCGGTTVENQAQILTDGGVPAHTETGATLSDLSRWVNEGRGVILEVNAGVLWNDAGAYDQGQANHAVVLTGLATDPESNQVLGFYINDSGRAYPGDSGEFISTSRMHEMWSQAGGECVVSDVVKLYQSNGTEV